MALKNNSYYMRRELAQVQLVRAWTYMQLVQLYGRVPFIVDPVTTSDTGWEKNPPLGWATPSNLLSLLEDKGGLKQAYAYTKQLGYPSYGKFNNGAENFDQSLSLFNANLVYADLYLLRGANKGDYEQAASYYYKYLKEDTKASVSGVAAVNHFVSSAGDDYFASIFINNFAGAEACPPPANCRCCAHRFQQLLRTGAHSRAANLRFRCHLLQLDHNAQRKRYGR